MENRYRLGVKPFFGLVETWVKFFTPSPQWQTLVHMHHQGLKRLVFKILPLLQVSQEQNS